MTRCANRSASGPARCRNPRSRNRSNWNLPGEPTGSRELFVTQLRVFFQVLVRGVTTGPIIDAVVSTAEPLTVFPRHLWKDGGEFESRITWLEPRHVYRWDEPHPLPPRYPGPSAWVFRDTHPFELGLILTDAYDDLGNVLRPALVIARFLTEPSPDIPDPIIGLEYSILTNRLLTRQTSGYETLPPHDPVEWWLREVA